MAYIYSQHFRKWQKILHDILWFHWDPIGLNTETDVDISDEYDPYIHEIYKLLLDGSTQERFFDHLWEIETEQMGLQGNRKQTMAIAHQLSTLDARSDFTPTPNYSERLPEI